jgi:basic amino acid/polyamine antiporter, APA family
MHKNTEPIVEKNEMKRELGLLDATLLVVGSMIGSGIFIVSADIGRQIGSPGYLLLVWLVTGLLTMTGALSYGELAGMMPRAGGQYVYLREAYNPLTGFLYGWAFFLVIPYSYPGSARKMCFSPWVVSVYLPTNCWRWLPLPCSPTSTCRA